MIERCQDEVWMRLAYEEALKAKALGEVPVGAVLVGSDHTVWGRGYNHSVMQCDPTAHAEIVAMREAAQFRQSYRLPDTTLYVTLEPCLMCAGALLHARIKRLVFATRDLQSGACGSCFNALRVTRLNHHIQLDEGFLQQESAILLKDFFKKKRSTSF